jgi:hypothetical protein
MPSRNNGQLIFAIIVTVLMFFGMCMIGLSGFPDKSGAITPLFPTPDNSNLFQQGKGTSQSINSAPSATITPTAKTSKTSPIATTSPNPIVSVTLTANFARPSANTPTPIRVVVSSQKRSWVYYHGPATYVRADAFAPLPLSSFPRPANDNGRGLHWFPTTYQTHAVVDRFVPELAAMKIRWVVILQGMDDWNMIANDYLIDRLNAEGILVVMRIDRQVGKMDWQRLGWIVARYRERGVRYFQIFNEPNAEEEWSTQGSPTPEQFISYWIEAAEVVAANGGLPGFAPMSPQPDDSDLDFFQVALEELKRLGRFDLVNMMWVSVHNYGDFDSRNPTDDGFYRYRSYDSIAKKVFGGSLPMIIAEGGLANAEQMASAVAPMYQFVAKEREPFFLAFAPWLIGNAVGGGHDPRWESAAWFTGTLAQTQQRSVVGRVKSINP